MGSQVELALVVSRLWFAVSFFGVWFPTVFGCLGELHDFLLKPFLSVGSPTIPVLLGDGRRSRCVDIRACCLVKSQCIVTLSWRVFFARGEWSLRRMSNLSSTLGRLFRFGSTTFELASSLPSTKGLNCVRFYSLVAQSRWQAVLEHSVWY